MMSETGAAAAEVPGLALAIRKRRFIAWIILLLWLGAGFAYFLWAGSNADPRNAIPWQFTSTKWLLPAAGIGNLLIASLLLFVMLSRMAWLLFTTPPNA